MARLTENQIGGIYLENTSDSDNLCIAIAFYFSESTDRPDGDEQTESDDNHHLGDWVMEKSNAALKRISEEINSA